MPLATLALILSIGYKIWVARLVDRADLALFFTTLDIFALSLVILVGFRSSMVVTYARTQDDLRILNIFRGIVLSAVLLSWGFVIPYLKHELGVDIHYWYLVGALLSMGLWVYLGNQLSMYRLYSAINRATLLEPLLVLGWFAFAWYLFDVRGLRALFSAAIMGSVSLSAWLLWVKIRHRVKEPPIKIFAPDEKMRVFLRQSMISTMEFGSGIVMIYLAVILLLRYHTPAELGDFQVVVKPVLMGLISIFVFGVFRFFLPELSRLVKAGDQAGIAQLKRWYVNFAGIAGVAIALFFLLFGQQLVGWLFPPEYAGAYLMLTHLAFFFPFVMLNAFQLATLKAHGEFFQALIVRISGLGFFLIAFFTIRLFSQSVIDVIMGLSLGYLGMFLLSLLLQRRLSRKSWTPTP
jgi:O-antigen/teichoic acid export membrane protein